MSHKMRALRKAFRLFLVVLGLLALVAIVFAYRFGIIFRYDSDRTFHSPIFAADGSEIYLIERNASGISWGPGVEFFTPPAKVLFLIDRLSLDAVDISTKKKRTLFTWSVPHEKGPREEYRNRLFGIPSTELRLRDGKLFFKIGLDVLPDKPNSRVNEWLVGNYDMASGHVVETKQWDRGYEMPMPWPEETLSGEREVLNCRNKAVLIYTSRTGALELLVAADGYGTGRQKLAAINVAELSHRTELERAMRIRETGSRMEQQFRDAGLSEGVAALRTIDEMEKLGLYPKSPRIVAEPVSAPKGDHEIFAISKEEFLYGLFQDIEEAIHKPGEEVHFWGSYIRHRDFDTSEKLNAYLDRGNRAFYVTTGGKTYLLKISR